MKTLKDLFNSESVDSRDILQHMNEISQYSTSDNKIIKLLKNKPFKNKEYNEVNEDELESELKDLEKLIEWAEIQFNSFEQFQEYTENEPFFISDYYFEEYARELAHDISANNFMYDFIDWKKWSEYLKTDYIEIPHPFDDSKTFLARQY